MSRVILTVEEIDKFNRTFADDYDRKVFMSIYTSIKYWQDTESGFLNFSLNDLFKEKYKENKFYLSLSNFVKKARELCKKGFLRVKSKGRLKFYGTSSCKSNDEIRKENEELKEKNEALNEELERVKKELEDFKREVRENLKNISSRESEEVIIEKVENKNYDEEVVPQDVVIETAYEIMEEVGIQKGSVPFMQTIESLYAKTDKEPIHKKGLASYIKKVIHNKIHNQSKFKELIKNERKCPTIFMTKAEEQKYINLERKLLGWDK